MAWSGSVVALWASVALAGRASAALRGADLDGARLEQLTGAKGALDEKEGVFKVSLPRGDLFVTVAGVRLPPPMGLTSWAAFQRAGKELMVMGDLVLAEDQVNPVMSAALQNGLEVTALHNHFLWDSPRVMFMHIGGMGSQDTLGAAVGKVFALIKQTSGGKGEIPRTEVDAQHSDLDPHKIDAILGKPGQLANGIYKIVIEHPTRMNGHPVGSAMGANTWAAFAGSDHQAIVDGDFAMWESELQGVLKALRGAGIHIVAIHQHMVGEKPRLLFLHFWGIGSTENLAEALKAALEVQNVSARKMPEPK